ncbi:MAG: hypothetical protein OXE92_02515 [Bacteroidetes bacterium]|nr:hypothetical protein [Bacteroidota bacterium]MCY4204581.1 hypothetical protein [Bacteroidota bacterium]
MSISEMTDDRVANAFALLRYIDGETDDSGRWICSLRFDRRALVEQRTDSQKRKPTREELNKKRKR